MLEVENEIFVLLLSRVSLYTFLLGKLQRTESWHLINHQVLVHKAVINSLQDFINRYKNILQNHVIDTTLASGNPLHCRRNF